MPEFTPTQGRYLSFIYAYTESLGQPPAESEIAESLKVQPPSAHGMIKTLEKKGLISRQPGVARSIEVLIAPKLIPAWKKKIKCQMQILAPANASQEWLDQRMQEVINCRVAQRKKAKDNLAIPNNPPHNRIYRFKISLCDYQPTIWRRIETVDVNLEQFHELIQTSMGWTNSHLHEFRIGKIRYLHPEFLHDEFDDSDAVDYSGIRISTLIDQQDPKLKCAYLYDFGDAWQHAIVLEKVFDPVPGTTYPRCVDGQLACPPEDVGGVWGYAEFVEAINDPDHDQHDDFLEWAGPFDPMKFDAVQATKIMRKGLPAW